MHARRYVTFGAPLAAVLAVGIALLAVASPRAVLGARVFGGPTDPSRGLSFRLEVVELRGGAARAVRQGHVEVEVQPQRGLRSRLALSLDTDGACYANLPPEPTAQGPLALTVRRGAALLAHGTAHLTATEWSARARERGGWTRQQPGAAPAGLAVRVAPARGALAVPFADTVLVEVTRAAEPLAGAVLEIEPDGFDVSTRAAVTDSHGVARVALVPRAHAGALGLTARTPDGVTGSVQATLPILEGALDARRRGRKLHVFSPITRERAYYAVITRDAQLTAGAVDLTAAPDGGAVGFTMLPELPHVPTWAVVSSEIDLMSPSAVGWPLTRESELELPHAPGAAPRTFAVAPRLWVDGVAPVKAAEGARELRVRRLAAAIAAISALIVAFAALARVRAARLDLEGHFAATLGQTAPALVRREPSGVALGLLSVLLGFLLLALFALVALR